MYRIRLSEMSFVAFFPSLDAASSSLCSTNAQLPSSFGVILSRACLLILCSCVVCATTFGQGTQIQEDKDDAFEELVSGHLTLRFYNALDGKEIPNAAIEIKGIGSYTTDEGGKIRFAAPEEDGAYPFRFQAAGFITSDFQFELMAGALFSRRFSVSPQMDIRYLRIVLEWGSEPRDLDAHFLKEGIYHISYRDMRTSVDGNGVLDRDDMDGYGPETITVKEISKDVSYRFYVHDFTDQHDQASLKLSGSRAVVRVFGEGKLLQTFYVPKQVKGTRWDVFSIHNGAIVSINKLYPQ